ILLTTRARYTDSQKGCRMEEERLRRIPPSSFILHPSLEALCNARAFGYAEGEVHPVPGFVMNETTNPPRYPSPEELRDFAVGDLGDADIDRIAGHVLDCDPCDRALRSLDEMTDGLLRSLSGFSPNAQLSAPLPEALLRVAQSAAGSGDPRRAPSCSDSCPDVSLDSGRRLARMLGEG